MRKVKSETETTSAPPVAIPEYEIHKIANLLPMITGPAWKEFLESVRRDGITSEIVLTPDGKTIIDGRNRYKACKELGIKPLTRKFGSRPTDGASVAAFIIRENLERRQLTDSQRAIAGAKLSKLGRGQKSKDGSELTQPDITALLNISGATLSRAKRATDKGTKAIQAMIEEQKISVSVGAALAGLPADEQDALAREGPVACRERAMQIMQPEKFENAAARKRREAKEAEAAKEKADWVKVQAAKLHLKEQREANKAKALELKLEKARKENEELVLSQTNQIKEAVFYQPFADWLMTMKECKIAKPLGGSQLKDKWATPDVVGTTISSRGDGSQFPMEIVAAEIKPEKSQLVTAFGQACAYSLFAHKSYLVIPEDASEDEIERIDALCQMFGIGLVTFDNKSPQEPDFKRRRRPKWHEPTQLYFNIYMHRCDDVELLS